MILPVIDWTPVLGTWSKINTITPQHVSESACARLFVCAVGTCYRTRLQESFQAKLRTRNLIVFSPDGFTGSSIPLTLFNTADVLRRYIEGQAAFSAALDPAITHSKCINFSFDIFSSLFCICVHFLWSFIKTLKLRIQKFIQFHMTNQPTVLTYL